MFFRRNSQFLGKWFPAPPLEKMARTPMIKYEADYSKNKLLVEQLFPLSILAPVQPARKKQKPILFILFLFSTLYSLCINYSLRNLDA